MSFCRPRPFRMSLPVLSPLLSPQFSVQRCNRENAVLQPALTRPAAQACVHVLGGSVIAVDRNQLGFVLAAEDARAHVTHGPCHSSPAQGAIDMNRSAGDDLCARGN